MMTDQNGTIMLVNIATERLLGYRRDELIGKSIEMLVPPRIRGGHINFRKAFDAHPEVRLMGKGRDLSIVRKDGTELPVEIGLNRIQMADGMMVLSAIVDISERLEAIRNLAAQREELQRSNADLEQFAYVASHDLQEPLRMVVTYAELLAERYQGNLDERANKYIKYTVDGARRMQQLIKELLEYSRVSSNAKVPIQIESALVVENAIQALKVAIDESGADVAHDKLPTVRADQAQLGQVFQNLLGNAIKFHGDRPPRIRIGAEQRNGKCVFRVEDNGIGIDKQYADRVFQMLQRLHERGQYEGNGIGLAIVKKIVERHGGHIWFEIRTGMRHHMFIHHPKRIRGAAVVKKRVHVLLVEDNPADADLTTEILTASKEVDVSLAKDGVEALSLLEGDGDWSQRGRPTLVLLDLNLPRKDGRQVLAVLKAHDLLRRIPVIVLSSSESDFDITNCYELGANCYITKPVDLQTFRSIVGAVEKLLAWQSQVAAPRWPFNGHPDRRGQIR